MVKAEESVFLSFTFTRKRLTISEKAFMRFKAELRRLTGRSWGVSMGRSRLDELLRHRLEVQRCR